MSTEYNNIIVTDILFLVSLFVPGLLIFYHLKIDIKRVALKGRTIKTMKKLFLEILVCLILASIDAAYNQNSDYQGQHVIIGQDGNINGNFHASTGSNSVYQSNGQSVIINRRMGPDRKEQTYVSVSNPKVTIDGDYCKSISMKTSFKLKINGFSFSLLQRTHLP